MGDLHTWFRAALVTADIELPHLTPDIAARAVELPTIHRDPIDRILIATAIEHDAILITRDLTIQAYPGVQTAWA